VACRVGVHDRYTIPENRGEYYEVAIEREDNFRVYDKEAPDFRHGPCRTGRRFCV